MADGIHELSPNPLRWGVLGAGSILRRNWPSMLESGDALLVAIASREPERAENFIHGMQAEAPWPQAPRIHRSYEALLTDPGVEAVYIPLPTGLRKSWVIAAAEAGKHVLCEKPCACGAEDLLEMIRACDRNGVHFMDGVMFMHGGRYERLTELFRKRERAGEPRRISSAFSFRAGDGFAGTDIRGNTELEPAGCLGDLGWYCLRASLWIMDWQLPVRVSGRTLSRVDGSGAIMEFAGELDFAGGATASFHCSFLCPDQMWLNLSGTSGAIRIPDFVIPATDVGYDWEEGGLQIQRPGVPEKSQAAEMFSRFAKDARRPGEAREWGEISLKTQRVQDACLLSDQVGSAVRLDGNPGSPAAHARYIQ